MCYPSANDLELSYLQHLVACLVFELENLDIGNQLDDNTIICIRTLVHATPASVMKLVDYLHSHPQDRQDNETYTYAFPFIQWLKPGSTIPPEFYTLPPCRQKLTSQRE
jgi:hypothetical protein